MKAFIWDGISKVSSNYHSSGSVLIIAETVERAREIAVFEEGYVDPKIVKMDVDGEPNFIFDSVQYEERVVVFPNAGCC